MLQQFFWQTISFSIYQLRQAFFNIGRQKTPKTQAQNSSQKLKEKTQSHGGTFYILQKTQEKNSILSIFV